MKRIIYIFLFILLALNLKAQDTYYSQFFANKIDLNPAFAGSQYYHRVIVNYRNQWTNLGNPYVTYSTSYDKYVKGVGGLAVQFMQDKQADGAQVTTSIKGVYAHVIKLNRNSAIRLALGCTYIRNQFDGSRLVFPDMIDPDRGITKVHDSSQDPSLTSRGDIDASFGLLAHSNQYTFGFSAQHLARPSIAFTRYSRVPYKFVLHAGAEYPIKSGGLSKTFMKISPLFLFQAQGENIQMNYGLYGNRNNLVAGCWFRQNFNLNYDSVIFMFGFDNSLFRCAYSFDLAVNNLISASTGVHELSVTFLMAGSKRKHRHRAMPCPSFFSSDKIF